MSRFSGPQPGYKSNGNKGVLRAYRLLKRQEAENRRRSAKIQKGTDSREPQETVQVSPE